MVLPPNKGKDLLEEKPAAELINMGFSKEVVKAVIETGGSYTTTESLLDAVMAYQCSMNDNEEDKSLNAIPDRIQSDLTDNSNLRNSLREKNVEKERNQTASKEKKTKRSRVKEIKSQTLRDRKQLEKTSESPDAFDLRETPATSSLSQEFSSLGLKDENKKMKSLRLCKICQENEVRMVILPCGHLISCSDCISFIANCTVCNQAVKGSVKVYLA